MPNVSMQITYAGKDSGCLVNRDARSYQAFDAVKEQVRAALCP